MWKFITSLQVFSTWPFSTENSIISSIEMAWKTDVEVQLCYYYITSFSWNYQHETKMRQKFGCFSYSVACLWWVCGYRLKHVSGTDNSFTSSGMSCRVSSFTFDTPSVLLFPDACSKEALIPTCSLRSELADTLVASRPEDAFIDLIANSILGVTMLSIAV